MSTKIPKADLNRRGFLKGVGTGATGAVTVAAGVGLSESAVAAESAADKKKVRYRASDHVKKYYETNRY